VVRPDHRGVCVPTGPVPPLIMGRHGGMRGYEQWHGAANSAPRWTWPEFKQWIKGKTPGVSPLRGMSWGSTLHLLTTHRKANRWHRQDAHTPPTLSVQLATQPTLRRTSPSTPLPVINAGTCQELKVTGSPLTTPACPANSASYRNVTAAIGWGQIGGATGNRGGERPPAEGEHATIHTLGPD
jgi:hypothetical protein